MATLPLASITPHGFSPDVVAELSIVPLHPRHPGPSSTPCDTLDLPPIGYQHSRISPFLLFPERLVATSARRTRCPYPVILCIVTV